MYLAVRPPNTVEIGVKGSNRRLCRTPPKTHEGGPSPCRLWPIGTDVPVLHGSPRQFRMAQFESLLLITGLKNDASAPSDILFYLNRSLCLIFVKFASVCLAIVSIPMYDSITACTMSCFKVGASYFIFFLRSSTWVYSLSLKHVMLAKWGVVLPFSFGNFE